MPTPKKAKDASSYDPKDRIRKHLKRKSSSRNIASEFEDASRSVDWATNTTNSLPFAPSTAAAFSSDVPSNYPVSAVKRSRLSGDSVDSASFFLDLDDSNAMDGTGLSPSPFVAASTSKALSRFHSLDSSETLPAMPLDFSHFNASRLQSAVEQREHSSLPRDCRLGCKLRIVAKSPFPCIPVAKSATSEVNIHTSGSARFDGIKTALAHGSLCNSRPSEPVTDSLSLLEAACLYFQFPSFPWLPMFPRCESSLKNAAELGQNLLPTAAIDVINRQWIGCFEQLFSTWKKGTRKEFYVACPNFTVLFTKNVDDNESTDDSASCFQTRCGLRHLAIMSQTTTSLREFFKSEGMEFEVCAQKRLRRKQPTNFVNFKVDENSMSNDTNASAVTVEENKENANEEEFVSPKKRTDDVWLNDIGISPNNTARLKKKLFRKAKSSTNNLKKLDSEEKEEIAAIVIKGSSVQTLYNIIQTSKIVRPIAGVYTNLPPTLIAAEPFLHSQMLSLKKSSSVIRREKESDFVVELSGGPVIPQHVEMAYEFIKSCNLSEASIRVTERTTNQGLNNYVDECEDWSLLRIDGEKIYTLG